MQTTKLFLQKKIKMLGLTALSLTALVAFSSNAYAVCTSPAGIAGSVIYNNSQSVMQYCDGTSWRHMGIDKVNYASSIESNLVAHWKLDETSGTTIVDSAGSHNGTPYGGLIISSATSSGEIDTSIAFDGVDDGIQVPNSPELENFTALTLSAWVYPTGPDPNGAGRIISKDDSGTGDNYALLYGTSERARLRIETDGDVQGHVYSDSALPMNTWSHVTATWDGSNMRMYVNGIESSASPVAHSGTLDADGSDLSIGTHLVGGSIRSFPGRIDDARIYNVALSAAEVLALYGGTGGGSGGGTGSCNDPVLGPTSGLTAYWRMDETSGSTIEDCVGSYDGTWIDGENNDLSEEPVIGKVNNAIEFDDNDKMTTTLKIGTLPAKTYAGWFYIDGSAPAWNVLLLQGDSYDSSTYVGLTVSNASLRAVSLIQSHGAGGTSTFCYQLSSQMPTNQWVHIAGVINKTADEMKVFINGALKRHCTGNGISGKTFYEPTLGVQVGAEGVAGTLGEPLQGKADDLRIYNRALSDAEVSALFLATGGLHSNLVGHWQLNELYGDLAYDLSGNGHHGTFNNLDPLTDSAEGEINTSLDFESGSSQRVNMGNVLNLPGSAMSISAWIKPESINFPDSIVDKFTVNQGYRLHLNMHDGHPEIAFTYRDSSNNQEYIHTYEAPDGAIKIGQWQHVVATHDGGSTAKIYVDGVEKASRTDLTRTRAVGTENLYIGYAPNNADYHDGKIDDVRIFDKALSASEVTDLYRSSGAITETQHIVRGKATTPANYTGSMEDIQVLGDYAYVTSRDDPTHQENGLHIFDISDPDSPSHLSFLFPFQVYAGPTHLDRSQSIHIDENNPNYLYMADYNICRTMEFQSVDISNPSSPVASGHLIPSSPDIFAHAMIGNQVGNLIWGTSGHACAENYPNPGNPQTYTSIWAIDVSTPSAPTLAHSYTHLTELQGAAKIHVHHNIGVVTFEDSKGYIRTYDLSDPNAITLLDTFSHPDISTTRELWHDGTYAYIVGKNTDNLIILDISNPASVSHIKTIAVGDHPEGLHKDGNLIYVNLQGDSGIAVIDISDPTTASVIEIITDPKMEQADDVYVYKDRVYTANSVSNLGVTVLSRTSSAASGLTGPAHHWKLDETSGTVAEDSAGSNDGTMTNGLSGSNSVTGVIDTAIDFDGSNDFIDVTPSLYDKDEWTVSTWVNMKVGGTEQFIYGEAIATSTSNRIQLWKRQDNDKLRINVDDGSGTFGVDSATALPLNEWHHITFTKKLESGSTDRYSIYIDGVLSNSHTTSREPTGIDTATIGAFRWGWTEDYHTDAEFDDFRIYHRALDSTEIAALASNNSGGGGGSSTTNINVHPFAGTTDGLVHYFKLDETSGITAVDLIGGSNGTMSGGLTGVNNTAGKIKTGIVFDGTNDYIATNNPTVGNESEYTYSAWFNTSNRDDSEFAAIFTERFDDNDYIFLTIRNNSASEPYKLQWRVYEGNVRTGDILSNDQILENTWYHAAVTRNGNTYRLYVNGVEASDSPKTITTVPSNLSQFLIGARSTSQRFFEGAIDDVRIYNRALSTAEIAEIYNQECDAGDVQYNTSTNQMQYCNDAHWVGMGRTGNGGGGCSSPTGVAGDMVYNSTHNVMQYCEGDQWIGIGK